MAENRNKAMTVRFTSTEKQIVTDALSTYGDPAVCARMILLSFATTHQQSRMIWPPESKTAKGKK